MKKLLLFTICFLFLFLPRAEALTVCSSGCNYTAISTCANAASAGDTCSVEDNRSYSGWSQSASGSSGGGYIHIKAGDGYSPTISSNITLSGVSYIRIQGFTSSNGISNSPSNRSDHLIIQDFIISGYNSDGIVLHADYVLIDNFEFDNTNSSDAIRDFGRYWIIRNSLMEDETGTSADHMDFWQSWRHPTSGIAATFKVFENNIFRRNSENNTHFGLTNGTSGDPNASENFIIRYNALYYTGSYFFWVDANSARTGTKNVIYNNTLLLLREGSHTSFNNFTSNMSASTNSHGINNLFYDAMCPTCDGGAIGFLWASGGAQSYNLYYDPGTTMTFDGLASSETGAVKNQDPLIVNMAGNDYTLSCPASPACDTGGPLTHANGSGSSSYTLIVDDAEFFQDNWGSWPTVAADFIAVGTVGNTTQISSINYDTETITLVSPISWSNGDSVWLYKDSDGTIILIGSAPDIGAYEYDSGVPVSRPIIITKANLN